jgi:hypothetical protein
MDEGALGVEVEGLGAIGKAEFERVARGGDSGGAWAEKRVEDDGGRLKREGD